MVSGELVRRVGYDLLITVIFLIYSFRLAGYSLVVQSQHIYLCEMMKPLGHSLALTLGSHYLTVNTTGDDTATLQVTSRKSRRHISKTGKLFRDCSGLCTLELGKRLEFWSEVLWPESLDTNLLGDYFLCSLSPLVWCSSLRPQRK